MIGRQVARRMTLVAAVLVSGPGLARAVGDEKPKEAERKPVRVLLFAGAPVREYQYVRTLLNREMDAKRAELCICLQPAGDEVGADVDQSVPPERMLARFPDRLGKGEKGADGRFLDLASYDVIIAFDPDWSRLSAEQLRLLRQWVEEQGGGLVVVAGPLHTYQLAAPRQRDRVKPVNDLLPVFVADARLWADRAADRPYRLEFPGKADAPFLKLGGEADKPLAFWDAYFGGGEAPERGFYSCHPVLSVKPQAKVHATFGDPALKPRDGGATPYLATVPAGKGKVAYLGSAEMWRLGRFNEKAHERFWNALLAFVAPGK